MPSKLVKVRRGLGPGRLPVKNAAKASTETLHVENASESKEPSSSQQQQQQNQKQKQQQQSPTLTSAQARAMVLDAFRSASNRLHTQSGRGILGSIAPPHNETVTKGAASGPQSPEFVDIITRPGRREKTSRKQVQVERAQKATLGMYLYLPGFGFKYQDDDDELGQ